MKVWNKGDRVQVRDRRDNKIVDFATVVEQENTTMPTLRDGQFVDVPSVTVFVDMDRLGRVGIPHACIEPINPRVKP